MLKIAVAEWCVAILAGTIFLMVYQRIPFEQFPFVLFVFVILGTIVGLPILLIATLVHWVRKKLKGERP